MLNKMSKVIVILVLASIIFAGCQKADARQISAENVRGFIASDNTHNQKLYNCAYYASESMAKAKAKGFDSYVVILYFDLSESANLYSSHVILAFDTSGGKIFYDPQQGREVKVEVGTKYWFPIGEYTLRQYIVVGAR